MKQTKNKSNDKRTTKKAVEKGTTQLRGDDQKKDALKSREKAIRYSESRD